MERADGSQSREALDALGVLCESYWYPIYAHVRRSGRSAHDAEDLTQGFFGKLLENDILAGADRSKGRLRTYLLTCLQNYLHNEHHRSIAARRDHRKLVSFDSEWAEERFIKEPVDDLSPDRLYQRRWAVTLLEFTLQLLSEEYKAADKSALFDVLRPTLGFQPGAEPQYQNLAEKLAMPVGTVKSHVFRLRQRWRQILWEQTALTLSEPSEADIKAELAELLCCL